MESIQLPKPFHVDVIVGLVSDQLLVEVEMIDFELLVLTQVLAFQVMLDHMPGSLLLLNEAEYLMNDVWHDVPLGILQRFLRFRLSLGRLACLLLGFREGRLDFLSGFKSHLPQLGLLRLSCLSRTSCTGDGIFLSQVSFRVDFLIEILAIRHEIYQIQRNIGDGGRLIDNSLGLE